MMKKLLLSLLGPLLFSGTAVASPPESRKAGKGKPVKTNSKWYNEKTKDFWVDGNAIPDVPFDVGESYAGLLSISENPNEQRKLFFWFFPSSNPDAINEVGIWFNGGPGCSSLIGLLTENGPFLWQDGTSSPVRNPYTWKHLTNYVWFESPVGVGFTEGVPSIDNEVDLALQFLGVWKNFVKTFSMQNFKIYLSGESYAGYYASYIADAFINANDTEYYNLKGVAINNPIIGDEVNQMQAPVMPYVRGFQNLFSLNQSFLKTMEELADRCKYTSYINEFLTYPPPKAPFPTLPSPFAGGNPECDILDTVYDAAYRVNPCFDIYHITQMCPTPSSQLGPLNPRDYVPPGAQVYFNRHDVQKAIHARVGTKWQMCTDVNVFANQPTRSTDPNVGHDLSPAPALNGVLQRVIEHTNNFIIGSGNLDFLLPTNGTLLAILNLTWNGDQGLRVAPENPFIVPYLPETPGAAVAGHGTLGSWGAERGLTFYQVQLAGHMVPGFALGAGLRSIELLLGRISNLSDEGPFTTQPGKVSGNIAHSTKGSGGDSRKQRLLNARFGATQGKEKTQKMDFSS